MNEILAVSAPELAVILTGVLGGDEPEEKEALYKVSCMCSHKPLTVTAAVSLEITVFSRDTVTVTLH